MDCALKTALKITREHAQCSQLLQIQQIIEETTRLDGGAFLLRFRGKSLLHAQPEPNSKESTCNTNPIKPMCHGLQKVFERPLKSVNNRI